MLPNADYSCGYHKYVYIYIETHTKSKPHATNVNCLEMAFLWPDVAARLTRSLMCQRRTRSALRFSTHGWEIPELNEDVHGKIID